MDHTVLDGPAPPHDRHMTPLGIHLAHVDHLVAELHQVEHLVLEHDVAALELRDVQDLVDQAQQHARRGLDLVAALFLAPCVLRLLVGDIYHADDPVDGRSDIVAHAAQELGLGAVGRLGARRGLIGTLDLERQALTVLLLGLEALGEMLALGMAAHAQDEHRGREIDRDADQDGAGDAPRDLAGRLVDVDVVVASAAHAAAVITAADADEPHPVGPMRMLDRGDDPRVDGRGVELHAVFTLLALFAHRGIVGGDDLTVPLDHDAAARDRAVALEQVLHVEREALGIGRVGLVEGDDHPGRVQASRRAHVDGRAVIEGHAAAIGLLRVPGTVEDRAVLCHIDERPVVRILEVVARDVTRGIEHDGARQAQLPAVLLEPLGRDPLDVVEVARELVRVLDTAHEALGRTRVVVGVVDQALATDVFQSLVRARRDVAVHRVQAHGSGEERDKDTTDDAGDDLGPPDRMPVGRGGGEIEMGAVTHRTPPR